eukprot:TRINITY_DN6700_c0_g1_i2.p1 TRINITY_DN6700_c0_g1~~TRINITY_DN6700_c0_g1_i2.p1  ORF type:complete len:511 (+),score=106.37 TRINITY_DN6700_c0_g1_i2:87-1619(+)
MKAIPFEESKRMPRLTHSSLAVIHPTHTYSPKKQRESPVDLNVKASPARLNRRKVRMPMLDTHLNSPPTLHQQTATTQFTKQSHTTDTSAKKKPTRGKSVSSKQKKITSVQTSQNNKRLKNGKTVAKKIFAAAKERQVKTEKLKKEDSKRPQTVSELYKGINLKSHIMRLYVELMKCPAQKPPENIHIKDFTNFVKCITPDIYENDIKDVFYYLASSKNKSETEEKLFVLPNELGKKYDEYIAEEENLKGLLSVGGLKARSYELHQKIENWKRNYPQRKTMHANNKIKSDSIISKLKLLEENTMLEKAEISKRIVAFNKFIEEKKELAWELKAVMRFLETVSNFSLKDLRRYLENEAIRKLAEFSLLKSFIEQVKQRCILDGNNFSLYDIPDVILSLKYGQTEYNLVINFVKKLKKAFVAMKRASGQTEQIADEDVVPLSLLDETFTRMHYHQEKREHLMNRLLSTCETEVSSKKANLSVSKERILDIIESNPCTPVSYTHLTLPTNREV